MTSLPTHTHLDLVGSYQLSWGLEEQQLVVLRKGVLWEIVGPTPGSESLGVTLGLENASQGIEGLDELSGFSYCRHIAVANMMPTNLPLSSHVHAGLCACVCTYKFIVCITYAQL